MKTYRVDHRKFYRQGVLYLEGDLVSLPDEVRPASSLHLVDDKVAPAKAPEKPAAQKRGRAADAEPGSA
jgi:hypothetical protein